MSSFRWAVSRWSAASSSQGRLPESTARTSSCYLDRLSELATKSDFNGVWLGAGGIRLQVAENEMRTESATSAFECFAKRLGELVAPAWKAERGTRADGSPAVGGRVTARNASLTRPAPHPTLDPVMNTLRACRHAYAYSLRGWVPGVRA